MNESVVTMNMNGVTCIDGVPLPPEQNAALVEYLRVEIQKELDWEIHEKLESVRRETWSTFDELMPKDDELILVTNGTYVEVAYMEQGSITKPWRFDKNDRPAFKMTDDGIMWKYINLPKVN